MSMARSSICIDTVYTSLRGKRVLVTGGASGIGRCLIEAFLAQEASAVCIDIDEEAIADLSGAVGGSKLSTYRCDLTDRKATRTVLDRIIADGPVDVLVNNAARDDRHSWDKIDDAYWDRCLAVNLDHQFTCSQVVARTMEARRQGVIINMGSVAWMRGRPAMVGYMTAKSAIQGLTHGLARELGPSGVRVLGIAPGAINTERQRRLYGTPEANALTLSEQALPIQLDGWDVANLVLFLASDAARGCTGRIYHVDAAIY